MKIYDELLNAETIQTRSDPISDKSWQEASILSLAIIWHSDHERIGALAPLVFDKKEAVNLSRLTPNFLDNNIALLDPHISRSPIQIKRINNDQFIFTPSKGKMEAIVNGKLLDETRRFHIKDMGNEIIIMLSNKVILSMFYAPARQIKDDEDYGLLGISRSINDAKNMIARTAETDVPVLIKGETGTGKELVAQGIYKASKRKNKPIVSVNMATIAPSLSGAELFGVKKGAFTGAIHDSKGLFEQADKGTLFLDEIGDTPAEVQPMLLRVLETGELKRTGDEDIRKVDVRFIAATDQSLSTKKGHKSFNQALLRRVDGIRIEIAPLRNRRVDIGILAKNFLQAPTLNLPAINLSDISAQDMHEMVLYDWPGNVRELLHASKRMRLGQPIFSKQDQDINYPTSYETTGQNLKENRTVYNVSNKTKKQYANPLEVDEEKLITALDRSNWVIKSAAEILNLSRTSLYELMEKSSSIRHIEDISDTEIKSVMASYGGGLNQWTKHLRVGRDALRKRITNMNKK